MRKEMRIARWVVSGIIFATTMGQLGESMLRQGFDMRTAEVIGLVGGLAVGGLVLLVWLLIEFLIYGKKKKSDGVPKERSFARVTFQGAVKEAQARAEAVLRAHGFEVCDYNGEVAWKKGKENPYAQYFKMSYSGADWIELSAWVRDTDGAEMPLTGTVAEGHKRALLRLAEEVKQAIAAGEEKEGLPQ